MEVMDDEDRMQQIGGVAGRVLLAVALVTARNKGDGLETRRVAGAAIGGADTQGETSQGATGEGPRFGVEQHRRHIDGTHDPDMASPPCRRVL